MIVGSWVLITINTLIFGFVIWLPQFFVQQGLTIANSFAYTLVLSVGSPIGCALGAYRSDAVGRRAEHHRRLGRDHRRSGCDLCPLRRGDRSRDRALRSASC